MLAGATLHHQQRRYLGQTGSCYIYFVSTFRALRKTGFTSSIKSTIKIPKRHEREINRFVYNFKGFCRHLWTFVDIDRLYQKLNSDLYIIYINLQDKSSGFFHGMRTPNFTIQPPINHGIGI